MNVRNRVLAVVGASLIAVSMATGAMAVDSTNNGDANVAVKIDKKTNGTVTVSITESTSFPDKEYSLASQTTSGVLTVQTSDDRGNAGGWNVTLGATDFIKGSQTLGANIPAGNLALTANPPVRNSAAGVIPTTTTSQPAVTNTPSQLWKANPGEGDGNFSLPLSGTLLIPAGALADTYTSTVTVVVSFAP